MGVGAYLYPWDVVGDPAAAARVADLGVDDVVLAAAYHSTRALTPFHPQHRIVVARHAAAYYSIDPTRWAGRRLRPSPATWVSGADAFGAAAAAVRDAGLGVHAWVVLAHNTRLGEAFPDVTVRNAYGDSYPWALCIAQDEVREYAATLVAEIASRSDIDGFELEACGWYGYDHQSAHDKSGGVPLNAAEEYLFSLCFCSACGRGYADAGLDPDELRATVRSRLDDTFTGSDQPVRLDASTADAVLQMRRRVGDRFRAEVAEAARPHPVLLHAHPDPQRYGANVGLDAPTALKVADGLVLNCWRDMDDAAAALAEVAAAAGDGQQVVASFLAIAGMGADLTGLPSRIERARAAGATDLRFYHAGLASRADLATLRQGLRA
ncbi:MAG TPA: hypothetical protein VE074_15320 [Jatrophihabitantaceae bacterium]|nr:hypothetical protein [Jatrophihabitantaceae bacterium]